MIHGDPHAFNTILVNNTGLVWIDFEDARVDFRIVDLAWLCLVGGFYNWTQIDRKMALAEVPRWDYINAALRGYSNQINLSSIEKTNFTRILELYLAASYDNCMEREDHYCNYDLFQKLIKQLNDYRSAIPVEIQSP